MENEQEQASNTPVLDAMGNAELFQRLVEFFGAQRVVELVGWVMIAGCIAEWKTNGDVATLRREMEARGMTYSSLYRALRDLRRFGEHIEGTKYPAQDHRPTLGIVRRLGQITAV